MAVKADKIIIKDPTMIPHHRLADKHRDMSEDGFRSFKHDIELNGQIYPVLTYKGKIVDGRHRQRALIELGIHDMKVVELPGNMSLKDVEEKVFGSENRRTDTPAQKAIRAYLWYRDNLNEASQSDAALKFGVQQADISRTKKLEDMLGINEIKKMYNNGYLMYMGKKYTNLRSLIKMMNSREKEQKDREPVNETVAQGFELLKSLYDSGDIVGVTQLESYAKKLRMKEV